MVSILARECTPVSKLVAALPEFFLIKDKITGTNPSAMIARVNAMFSAESIDRTDGIRINRADSWALVRPSGTEPLVRVIVESPRKEIADAFFGEIMQSLVQ